MKKQNIRTLSLIVTTATYLLIGAALFDAIESEEEEHQLEALQVLERNIFLKYNITQDDFDMLEEVVYLYKPYKAGKPWKFAGSFYYATTVLTTIGYGHSTPKTPEGKMFTLIYAFIGIPLGLVMFNSIGERLNKFSSTIINKIRRRMNAKQLETTEVDLIMVVMFFWHVIGIIGTFCFSSYEGWTLFDSAYYCFTTLTTIGFGDLVALQQDNALEERPEYVTFALFFIMFGLAVISAGLNLMVLKFMTLNTEDEKRDEIEAAQAARLTVRLDGDIIIGDMISDKRFQSEGLGSIEDMQSVCSCTCLSCHPGCFHFPKTPRHRPPSSSPPLPYTDYYMSPPRLRHSSVHDLRRTWSHECLDMDYLNCPAPTPMDYLNCPAPSSANIHTANTSLDAISCLGASPNISRADISYLSPSRPRDISYISPSRPNDTAPSISYHFREKSPLHSLPERKVSRKRRKKTEYKRTSL